MSLIVNLNCFERLPIVFSSIPNIEAKSLSSLETDFGSIVSELSTFNPSKDLMAFLSFKNSMEIVELFSTPFSFGSPDESSSLKRPITMSFSPTSGVDSILPYLLLKSSI